MNLNFVPPIRRREFLKLIGATAALGSESVASPTGRRIALMIDPGDPVACSDPGKWAAGQLRQALADKGAVCEILDSPSHANGFDFCVLAAGSASSLSKRFSKAGAELAGPESLRIVPAHLNKAPATLVSGSDPRGLTYGLLELAERVQFGPDPVAALQAETLEERPANQVRSVARAFCSEVEDKSWYYDKDFWRGYLDVLARSRFNRFNFALGFGYDFPRHVTGDYFHFSYPYLVDVPGYDVRVICLRNEAGPQTPTPLSASERERNFEILRFIAAETALRGLQFQLGIWTHAYQWTDSPNADHRIDGLTPDTHAAYCRDALALILKSCPEIQGLTLRVHGESGIPEGSYSFWRTLFEAISGAGRKIEIEMHSKGVNQTMIDMAAGTGMPVKLGCKYSAEHQSLGYHQADIRELEMPKPGRMETGLFSVSNGARRFTRYGYADFFQQGSRFQVLFRLWPGTQRHLLSADPEMAAAYGRTAHFCGAAGLELCEPLTFKGREGSGLPGGRCAYADESLNPQQDWKRFEYYYRVWGRRLYNPDADSEVWRRHLRSDFGSAASSVETAVANASRILPILTSAHLPSASNHSFWPEIDTNMPMVLGSEPSPYGDTPTPKCFGTVSPLDPQLFSTIVEHAADLLSGRANAKYSPIEVALWLDNCADAASRALSSARASSKSSPEFRRIEEDVLIQNGLGQFFAAKLRSGVLYEICRQTGDARAGKLALEQYQKARAAWAAMAQRAQKVYRANITYGDVPIRQGHWIERLPGIDKDLDALHATLQSQPPASAENAERAIRAVMQPGRRASVECSHTPPAVFEPGKMLAITLDIARARAGVRPSSVLLHYRHVNQAERWRSIEMEHSQNAFHSAIPGEYTNSAFPLQYYFELRRGTSEAWLYPAFNATWSNQPYFAIYKREAPNHENL
jgi:hypothetical protein